MKGIVLAGGKGTRLYPLTRSTSKQLLPIYDKPMIYYPLSVLLLAGIREILIISTPRDLPAYRELFGDGTKLGLNFCYMAQEKPKGLADAFIVGEDFIGDDEVAMILGDNFFYGQSLTQMVLEGAKLKDGALIFGYYVKDPVAYGVVEVDAKGCAISLEEKPQQPRSNYAVPGLYFYDKQVSSLARQLKPSPRGELEITDLNRCYMDNGKLKVKLFGRGLAWLDSGSYDGLMESSNFVKTIQKRQGLYIGCIEEIVYNANYIDKNQLKQLAEDHKNTDYGKYLSALISHQE